VVSVCPPHAAVGLAGSVAALRFAGIYVDANAVSPATARAVDECVSAHGARYVDGGIIGGPDAPRLFLAGAAAADVGAECGAPVEPVVLDDGRYAASALKMVYAGWTKATTALLLSLVATARRLGVETALRTEWERSQPALGRRLDGAVASTAKAWRWEGEMVEIARTFADAGLPAGFHSAAAEVFTRLAMLKDDDAAGLDDVLALLAV
jgi:3-hydroxyisobutyrate dehydrogenase-like beta-hydroxyacid dehydrogenase